MYFSLKEVYLVLKSRSLGEIGRESWRNSVKIAKEKTKIGMELVVNPTTLV